LKVSCVLADGEGTTPPNQLLAILHEPLLGFSQV
jgi:hypothetical protein